jgi:hypothetical protein
MKLLKIIVCLFASTAYAGSRHDPVCKPMTPHQYKIELCKHECGKSKNVCVGGCMYLDDDKCLHLACYLQCNDDAAQCVKDCENK